MKIRENLDVFKTIYEKQTIYTLDCTSLKTDGLTTSLNHNYRRKSSQVNGV